MGFALCLALASLACESTPVQKLRGARYYAEGSEALERGDSERAVADLQRAAILVPEASEIQNHLGLAYWAVGELGRARSAFDRALELDCDNRAARQNLASLDAATRRPETPKSPEIPGATQPVQPVETRRGDERVEYGG